MDDDFLWSCQLSAGSHRWDLESSGAATLNSKFQQITHRISNLIDVCGEHEESEIGCGFSVAVQEIKGDGVMDLIGGEIWEASLYLCAYLMFRFGDPGMDRRRTNSTSFLELGAGLGLPSFLLYHIYKQQRVAFRLCMSDYDNDLLSNLNETFLRWHNNDDIEADIEAECKSSDLGIDSRLSTKKIDIDDNRSTMSIIALDWSDFQESEGPDCPAESIYSDSWPEIIFGSALCYSESHSSLADTIKYFLIKGSSEFICIQRRDRLGFSQFLERLTVLGLKCSMESISSDIIEYSNNIAIKSVSKFDISSKSIIRAKQFVFPPILKSVQSNNNAANSFVYSKSNVYSHGNRDDVIDESKFKFSRDQSVFVILKVVL